MCNSSIAVISDIHGNRWALDAVLQDIQRRALRDIVNLGDSLYGPLDPFGTARILLQLDIPTVRGNEDRLILDAPGDVEHPHTLRYVRESLSRDQVRWLENLSHSAVVFTDVLLCHGSPQRDDEYLLYEVTERGVTLRDSVWLAEKIGASGHSAVFCGHDHLPRTVVLPSGELAVSPGSVGLPAFTDGLPFPHAMQTGAPHARYSIVSRTDRGWLTEDIAVPYDWGSAVRAALQNGRPDWAEWLQTGRASLS